jgi:hypothetical protein
MDDAFMMIERWQWTLEPTIHDLDFSDFVSLADGAQRMYEREARARQEALER